MGTREFRSPGYEKNTCRHTPSLDLFKQIYCICWRTTHQAGVAKELFQTFGFHAESHWIHERFNTVKYVKKIQRSIAGLAGFLLFSEKTLKWDYDLAIEFILFFSCRKHCTAFVRQRVSHMRKFCKAYEIILIKNGKAFILRGICFREFFCRTSMIATNSTSSYQNQLSFKKMLQNSLKVCRDLKSNLICSAQIFRTIFSVESCF